MCVRGHAWSVGAARCAHTCHHGFVPPFQQRLREATDAGRSGCVCVRVCVSERGKEQERERGWLRVGPAA